MSRKTYDLTSLVQWGTIVIKNDNDKFLIRERINMKLKTRLIQIYENIYASNFVMSLLYKYKNRNYQLNIMKTEDTVRYIIETGCSVARFGEGEFELMLSPSKNLGFQVHSDELAEKLVEVIQCNNENLLICVPYALNSIWGRTKHSRMFWYSWGNFENQHCRIVDLIKKVQDSTYVFGDTQISRPYVAYKSSNKAKRIFPALKKIWDGKDVIIVEGSKTRLGVGNDLFGNVLSVKRILAPAKNAFSCYQLIIQEVVKIYKHELILLALGPTATVLAYEFSKLNMRALDLGHIDIEYEWFLHGSHGHDIISGKYTNEAEGGNVVDDCLDENYLKEIVAKIEHQDEYAGV